MAHERARSLTPILDCIEVAGSVDPGIPSRNNTSYSSDEYQETEMESDSQSSIDQDDAALLKSLDSGSRARARFQLSPDKSPRLEVRANANPPRLPHCHPCLLFTCWFTASRLPAFLPLIP